jgi:hypothetical protein
MAGVGHPGAGAPANQLGALSVEATLWRAALLAGYGARARPLASRLAAATTPGAGRSCLEAGAPLQLTVDAPGPPGLRVGVRLGDRFGDANLDGLMPASTHQRLVQILAPLPVGEHASLGTWLFWTETRQSVFIDLRDPSPVSALARLEAVLTPDQKERLAELGTLRRHARPWAFRIELDEAGIRRLHVHWLVERGRSPRDAADAIAPGAWDPAMAVFGRIVRQPGVSGRWLVVTPLDDRSEPALRIGSTGWSLVPENQEKHQAIGDLMRVLDGPRDHAEALWSLCRGLAAPAWRVGRACEVTVGLGATGVLRARLFLTPQVQTGATAGTSSSGAVSGSTGASTAAPASE